MSKHATFLTEPLYHYLLQVSVRPNAALIQLNEATQTTFDIPMQSSPEALNFLAWLVRCLGAKRVLEVGTFTGLSALAMAQALPEEGEMVCVDHSENFTALGREHWAKAGVSHKITLHIGEGIDVIDRLVETHQDYFDMMFIDADKKNNRHYYEAGLHMVRTGGVILIDNVLWLGRVADANETAANTCAIREFNEFLFSDERVDMSLLPLGDGLTLARKR